VLFDAGIEVFKAPAKLAREQRAHCRLAAAHEAAEAD
jgi:hypothetical protein